MLNDTIIQITSGYWGGTMTYKLDIESVSDNTLKVEAIYENQVIALRFFAINPLNPPNGGL